MAALGGGEGDRADILSFRWKFDLICNVKLFFPPPSLSDQNSKKEFPTNLEESPSWQLASHRNVKGVQFQCINKTKRVFTPISGGNCHKTAGRDTADDS